MSEVQVDRSMYPFTSRFLEIEGGRIHYVDEGEGPALLMVHGTPTWSFLYRHLIRDLSRSHRVIAPDHLGFGLSEKPETADYRPEAHARRLETLIEQLGLTNIVLVVHDFGGPIGLSYAIENPQNVRGLVLLNTWMWSLAGASAEKVSRAMSGAFGRFLYRRLNFSPRVLLPMLYGNRSKLTKDVHRHYLDVFPSPRDRQAPWIFARELMASAQWYDDLWRRRDFITNKPALLLWGMKDSAFGAEALARWREALPEARVVELADVGHFVQEEAPDDAIGEIGGFLSGLEDAPARQEPR